MGAWSVKPFGNDTALDWCLSLEKQDIMTVITNTVQNCKLNDESSCEETIAAAQLVASASQEKLPALPPDLKALVKEKGFVPNPEILPQTIKIVEQIHNQSALAELWAEEASSYKSWQKNLVKLIEELKQIDPQALPERAPKPKRLPRKLNKLLELPDALTNPHIRQKIREKVVKLEEINGPSKEFYSFTVPIEQLIKYGFFDEAKILIERGADINQSYSRYGGTALCAACMQTDGDFVDYLISKGALVTEFIDDPLTQNVQTSIPLTVAISHFKAPEVPDRLLAHGADLYQFDINGRTLMHNAAANNNIEAIKYLLSKGMDINIRNKEAKENLTALERAIDFEAFDVALFLVEQGCEITEGAMTSAKWKRIKCRPLYDRMKALKSNSITKAING